MRNNPPDFMAESIVALEKAPIAPVEAKKGTHQLILSGLSTGVLTISVMLYTFGRSLTTMDHRILEIIIALQLVLMSSCIQSRYSEKLAYISHLGFIALIMLTPWITWAPQLLLFHVALVIFVIYFRKRQGECLLDVLDQNEIPRNPWGIDTDIGFVLMACLSLAKLAYISR